MNINKKQVIMKDGYFWVQGEKIKPLCGEFHFWRNNVLHWPRIFKSIKDLGFEHIASYIEWNFHRITPDGTPLDEIKYDFKGETNPQRDLVRFLEAVKEHDLWLNIRPGPYIYAETEFGGPPGEAAKYHRLHPNFLELAEHYLNHVLPILKPYLATNGGPIFLAQLDNESSMIKHQEQVIDASVEENGSFRSFLKEKYGDLSSVNETYDTSWDEWDEVEPALLPVNKKDFLAYLDVSEFLEWYNAQYFDWCADIFRKNGIHVPYYVNSTGPPFPHDPVKLESSTNLRAADIYYVKKDRLINMLTLNSKLLRATNPLTFSAEFRSGWNIPMEPKDYSYQAVMWMMYGFQGVNYFMLVERHRWPYTPIDWVGRPMNNQLYNRFKNICRVYNQIDFPRFTTNRISSVHLIWNRDHHMANKSAPMEPGFRLSHDYANNKTFRALVYGNIPFELYYPEISPGKLKPESMPVLMYAGQSFLSRKTAEKILSYIKKGGHMICVQNYPYKTKHGEKLEVFEKYIISPKGSFQTENNCYVQMGECSRDEFPKMIKLDTTILQEFDLDSVKDSKPGDLNPFFYKHMYIGYTRKIGKGKLSVLGFPLTKNSVEPILDALGIQSPLTVSNSDLLTTVQIDSRNLSGGSKPEILLGILNPENEPVNATLKLDLGQLSILAQTDFSMEDYALNYMFKKKKEVLDSVKKIPVALKAQSGELLWLKPQNEKENLN